MRIAKWQVPGGRGRYTGNGENQNDQWRLVHVCGGAVALPIEINNL